MIAASAFGYTVLRRESRFGYSKTACKTIILFLRNEINHSKGSLSDMGSDGGADIRNYGVFNGIPLFPESFHKFLAVSPVLGIEEIERKAYETSPHPH